MVSDNSWLTPLLSWAGTYLVHSTLLIAMVWVILRLCSRAGQPLRELMWKTALVGGVATSLAQGVFRSDEQNLIELPLRPSPKAPVAAAAELLSEAGVSEAARDVTVRGVVTLSQTNEAVNILHELDPAAGNGADWAVRHLVLNITNAKEPVIFEYLADAPAAENESKNPAIAEESSRSAGWWNAGVARACLSIVLLAGLWGGSRALWQSCLLRRRLSECVPVQGGVAYELLEELRETVPGCRPVDLLASADESEPAALGVWRWKIILPERAERELSRPELRSLLAHELAHLVRGDSVWLLISRLVCSGLAFQPLNQFVRREWQKSAEFQCDAWAVARTGSPLALARCLTEVASWRLDRSLCAPTLAATGRRSGLGARIERLLHAGSIGGERNESRPGRVNPVWTLVLLIPITFLAPRLRVEGGFSPEFEGTQKLAEIRNELPEQVVNGEPVQPADRDLVAGFAVFEAEAEVARLFHAVEREMSQLDRELIELAPLLSRSDAPAEVHEVVRLIHWQTAQMRGRRWMLLQQFSNADDVAVPSGGEQSSL